MHPDFTGNMRKNLKAVFEFYLELRIWKCFQNHAFNLN